MCVSGPKAGDKATYMKHKLFLTLALTAAAMGSYAASFELTVTNHGPQPLSPLFWSAGNSNFDIFQFGQAASLGIKNVAESGDATVLANSASTSSDVQASGVLGGSPLMPGQSRTVRFDADDMHSYFSFASMLGMTNDGFIGESVSSMGLRLFTGNIATGFSVNIYGARAWDAGTEDNTQSSSDIGAFGGSGNPADPLSLIRVHETIVPGRGDVAGQLPDWSLDTRLATVTVLPVPEPATMTALALGAAAVLRRRK